MKLSYQGTNYTLAQFHIHSPSEHTVNGRLADGELHMVHESSSGALIVLGVLLVAQKSLKTSFLDPFFKATICAGKLAGYPKGRELSYKYSVTAPTPLNPYKDILPVSKKFYNYDGSLTTYPCTEGVTWFVFDQAVSVTVANIAQLKSAWAFEPNTITLPKLFNNNRPIQPLNNRVVQSSCNHKM